MGLWWSPFIFYDVTYLPAALKRHAIRYLIALRWPLAGCAVTHNGVEAKQHKHPAKLQRNPKKVTVCRSSWHVKVGGGKRKKKEKVKMKSQCVFSPDSSRTLLPFVAGHNGQRSKRPSKLQRTSLGSGPLNL